MFNNIIDNPWMIEDSFVDASVPDVEGAGNPEIHGELGGVGWAVGGCEGFCEIVVVVAEGE